MSDGTEVKTEVKTEVGEVGTVEKGNIPFPGPEKKEPPTLLENLNTTRAGLVEKLELLDRAIALVDVDPTITEYNNIMSEFQKMRV